MGQPYCPFCRPEKNRIRLDSEFAVAFPDGFPITEGHTLVSGVHHIDRGYPRFEEALRALGADVTREPDDAPYE